MCVSCSEHNKVSRPVIVANTQPTVTHNTKKSQEDHHNELNDDEEDDDFIPPYQPRAISQPSQPHHPSQTVPNESDQTSQPEANEQRQPSQPRPNEPHHPPNKDPQVSICPVYKWGRCPNYEKCKFRHPPRCWNWLSSGKCRFNNKCKYHHPPLCKTSVREHKCFNENCVYFHLSKTLRHNAEEEQLRTSLHKKAYSNQSKEDSQNDHTLPSSQVQRKEQHTANARTQKHEDPPPRETPEATTNHSASNLAVNQSNETPLNNSNVNFLVTAIRDLLREDLKKELSGFKVELNHLRQVQALANQQFQAPMLLPLLQKNAAQQQIPTPQVQPQVSQIQQPTTQFPLVQSVPNILLSNPQTM